MSFFSKAKNKVHKKAWVSITGSKKKKEAAKKQQKEMAAEQKKADAQMREMMKAMTRMEMPEITIPEPPVPEPIAPAATQSSANVEDAQADTRRQARRRKGLLATTYAGETGGYGGTPMGGGKSLLG